MTTYREPMPDTAHRAVEFVDRIFDFYDHVLACQREFAKSWLVLTTSAATRATSAAHDVTKEPAPKRDVHDGVKEPALQRS